MTKVFQSMAIIIFFELIFAATSIFFCCVFNVGLFFATLITLTSIMVSYIISILILVIRG